MKKVILYSTSWCSFCHAEADWLEHNKVEFELKDIERDEAAMTELKEKMNGEFRGVPVTVIDDEVIVGFDRPKLTQLLEIERF
ncbi:MAG: NrdH-redoxin [Candidatus Sacchiramonaceae bacterium]|nr:NrdH-redoxin [Candidatus Saccharimonadaceae bacterium]